MENGMAISPKIKHRITVWMCNSPSDYIPKKVKAKTQTDIYIPKS